MADLRDLFVALTVLKETGKTAKVSFYYTLADDLKMRSGSISVQNGADCYINHQQQAPEAALRSIAQLQFAKITTLPGLPVDHDNELVPVVDIGRVLERLDPRNLVKPAPPAAPVMPVAMSMAVPAAPAKPAHVFYSHLSLQKDVLELLEPIFGVAAGRKMEEFAQVSPPGQHPVEFLNKCRQHAAMMLGAKKAEALFQPIFDKL